METIVKYRFDRELVAFVKTLDIKTAMFGYDKNDVYSKFKDLLVKSRDVCEELVAEQHKEIEAMKADLVEAVKHPDGLDALLRRWEVDPEATDELADGAMPETEEDEDAPDLLEEQTPEAERPASEIIDSLTSPEAVAPALSAIPAVSDASPLGEEKAQLLSQVSDLKEENEVLRAQLDDYSEREEVLRRADAIVTESRLEGETIIRDARVHAEQELFMYRAKRREEEETFAVELSRMETERNDLRKTCERYREYIRDSQSLFDRLQAFAADFDDKETPSCADDSLQQAWPLETNAPEPSIPVDSGCSEQAQPLCEFEE
ncbi:MAG TPA: hypothetical protein VFD19_04665 [Clostridia bacterium]|nr:hypothetical protein [Clostridia bacterium]